MVLHDWHVWRWRNWLIERLFPLIPYDNPVWVRKDQTFDITGVMGIPPKVEYGREKDTRIRDDRFGDQAGD
jgi:hypothetical protein